MEPAHRTLDHHGRAGDDGIMTTEADIDAMLAARKTLAGRPVWREDERGTVAHMVVPIAKEEVIGGLTFRASALLFESAESGSCVIVLDDRPIQRLSFRPTHAHVNPFGAAVSVGLRGLRCPAGVSRIHHWAENRRWPRPLSDNVAVASPLHVEFDSFALTLALFLHICNIDGELPPPPWEPRLL